ncbi:hypothetical protein BVY03_00320 [bacterium K02(2017)]|nr:hypothetical protein BVY03_00320 [bacterium K02(2017)]
MLTKNKIHFIHSAINQYEVNYGNRFIPLWAYTLASYIPKNWEVTIYDVELVGVEKVEEATVFAFSGINQDCEAINNNYKILKQKYPLAKFVIGGPIVWSYQQANRLQELDHFDYIIVMDGEEALPWLLNQINSKTPNVKKIMQFKRFNLNLANTINFDLLKNANKNYYGGIVEVSRGCPFLCEFCDIRVLPDNNRSHHKAIETIIKELDAYCQAGIFQFQLACDNFIGDPNWAKKCVEAILDWQTQTKHKIGIWTWLTVDIVKHPELMRKMRRAGFSMLFIGVESFNASSIIETAKVQNKNDQNQMVESIKKIQAFGFVVVPGLIFGFDNDDQEMFDDMNQGMVDTGLIGGDPSFLVAMPGTPLYKRMSESSRIIDESLSPSAPSTFRTYKLSSNIQFLQDNGYLKKGYLSFAKNVISPDLAFKKFKRHLEIMQNSTDFVAVNSASYVNPVHGVLLHLTSFEMVKRLVKRLLIILNPKRFWVVLKAFVLFLKISKKRPGLFSHYVFWLFNWTNLIDKYQDITNDDLRLESVDQNYDYNKLWKSLEEQVALKSNGRDENNIKVADQLKYTAKGLVRLKEKLLKTNG